VPLHLFCVCWDFWDVCLSVVADFSLERSAAEGLGLRVITVRVCMFVTIGVGLTAGTRDIGWGVRTGVHRIVCVCRCV
jgi:hypothetical protein